jgi:hypothetical protein
MNPTGMKTGLRADVTYRPRLSGEITTPRAAPVEVQTKRGCRRLDQDHAAIGTNSRSVRSAVIAICDLASCGRTGLHIAGSNRPQLLSASPACYWLSGAGDPNSRPMAGTEPVADGRDRQLSGNIDLGRASRPGGRPRQLPLLMHDGGDRRARSECERADRRDRPRGAKQVRHDSGGQCADGVAEVAPESIDAE